MAASVTHHSGLAGTWYPARAPELRAVLQTALETSAGRTGPFVRPAGQAFLVPHAAPVYSGAVAASAYRHIQATQARRVLLLGFCHRQPVRGIAVPQMDGIETPLGRARVDRDVAAAMAGRTPFHAAPVHSVCDHSVEIQIPFLQMFLPEASLVPLYAGPLSQEERQAAAGILRDWLGPDTILIASSDLTHFGAAFGYLPFPADESTPERLRLLDRACLDAAASLDPAIFRQALHRTGATVCGSTAIELLLETVAGLTGDWFQETLDYENSAAITGDFSRSVSYAAAAWFPAEAFRLAPEDQARLLDSSRFSLHHYRRAHERCFQDPPAASSALWQRSPVFVTLHAEGQIRGCVGNTDPAVPLWQSVPQLTLAAGRDERFPPLRADEDVDIEIHILTPPKRISRPDQIGIGRHGISLRAGAHRGLLLPVVATRYGLAREDFLRALARKAGLEPVEGIAEDWEVSVFCDQSFCESDFPRRAGTGNAP